MAAVAASVVILPVRKAAEGSQNTERPMAKPDAVALAAHAANQRSMVDRSAALPRMICRQAGVAAMAASIVPAPSDAPRPPIFQNSGARPRREAPAVKGGGIARRPHPSDPPPGPCPR